MLWIIEIRIAATVSTSTGRRRSSPNASTNASALGASPFGGVAGSRAMAKAPYIRLTTPLTRSASGTSEVAFAFSVPATNHGSTCRCRFSCSQSSGKAELATIHPMVPHTRTRGKAFVGSGRLAMAIELVRLSVGM